MRRLKYMGLVLLQIQYLGSCIISTGIVSCNGIELPFSHLGSDISILFLSSSIRPDHAASERLAFLVHRQASHHLTGYGYRCHFLWITSLQQYPVIRAEGLPPILRILLGAETALRIMHGVALLAMGYQFPIKSVQCRFIRGSSQIVSQ